MKKRLALLLLLLALWPSVGNSKTVMSGLTPTAANQLPLSLCWAATDSALLYSTGWSVSSSAQATFSDFATHWPNAGQWPDAGLTWYFDGGYVSGGAYHPAVAIGNVMEVSWDQYGAANEITKLIDKGWGVGIAVYHPSGSTVVGHELSIWGYETDDATGLPIDLYYTNSWGDSSLQEMALIQSGNSWYTFSSATWDIRQIVGLMPEEDYSPHAPLPIPDPIPPDPNTHGVGEPFTALLVGMGLAGLVVCKKKLSN